MTDSSSESPSLVVLSHQKPLTYLFRRVFWLCSLLTVLDLCIFLTWFRQDDFSLDKAMLRIDDLYFSWKQRFEVKNFWIIDLFTIIIISCLDSHSDGTHSLQRIHWLASNAKFLQICLDEETNSSTSWGRVYFQQFFIFENIVAFIFYFNVFIIENIAFKKKYTLS